MNCGNINEIPARFCHPPTIKLFNEEQKEGVYFSEALQFQLTEIPNLYSYKDPHFEF